ncbi:hypothetical protein [Kitasatospora sp. NPDC006786]|uniref:hypothetical protein n=1 Tax=unclassified Kitasatospora TaxID=2633591 RepID=UPI0033CEC8DC
MEIDLTDLPLDLVPVIIAPTRRELEQAAPAIPEAHARNATRIHHRRYGNGWAYVRWTHTHHNGRTVHNSRHILTSDPTHRWWSIPIHPRSSYFLFNPSTGHPVDYSARPYPHPVTNDNTDPLHLCPHCGSRGQLPVRCTPNDPNRHHEQHRYPNGRPWKYLPCPAGCTPTTEQHRLFTPPSPPTPPQPTHPDQQPPTP